MQENSKFILPLKLQHFAEGEENNGEEDKGKEDTNKTFSQEEVLALIQSEADKRVNQALATERKKHEKELAKQKSLANMDEHQREIAERDAQIAELLEERKQNAVIREKAEIAKVLSNRGLNVSFVDMLSLSDNNEENLKIIDNFDKLFKQALAVELDKRTKGKSPATGTTGLDGQITKEQFNKMSPSQQQELFDNNKELYMQLVK